IRTVKLHPQAVGLFPFRARQTRGAVHVVPVRRVMPFQLGNAPFHPQRGEHVGVGLRVGFEGIEQRSVPVEEYAFQYALSVHGHWLHPVTGSGGKCFRVFIFAKIKNSTHPGGWLNSQKKRGAISRPSLVLKYGLSGARTRTALTVAPAADRRRPPVGSHPSS